MRSSLMYSHDGFLIYLLFQCDAKMKEQDMKVFRCRKCVSSNQHVRLKLFMYVLECSQLLIIGKDLWLGSPEECWNHFSIFVIRVGAYYRTKSESAPIVRSWVYVLPAGR